VTGEGVVRAQGQRPLQRRKRGRRRAHSPYIHVRATPNIWALRTCRPAMPPRQRQRLTSRQQLQSARRPGQCRRKRAPTRKHVSAAGPKMCLLTARLLVALC